MNDPVRARRAMVAYWTGLAKRIGYLMFLVACVVFGIGAASGFPGWAVSTVIVNLVLGSCLLLPAIVLGYAVKAAERDDRERGV